MKEKVRITNKEYQELTGVKERLAAMELNVLVQRKIVKKYGTTGRGTYYAAVKGQKRKMKMSGKPKNPPTNSQICERKRKGCSLHP